MTRLRTQAHAWTLALVGAIACLTPASPALAAPFLPAQTEDLAQTVEAEEQNVSGRAVLDAGHVDVGPRFVDGRWSIQARDDSSVPAVWRPLSDTVTRVVDAAVQPAPDADDFSFLDAAPGSDVYVIPQTEQRGVVWMGWNTQDPTVMERVDRGVTFTLHGTTGPGEVSVFLQNGNFGSPDVLWDSSITGAQDLWVDTNTHTHANWIFTEPGTYLLDFEISADLIDGQKVSDRQVLRFAVGDATDPEAAFAAEASGGAPASGEEASTGDSQDAAPEPGAEARQQWVLPLLAGAALVAVLTGGSVGVMRSRKARRKAHRDFLAELEAADQHTTAPAGGRR